MNNTCFTCFRYGDMIKCVADGGNIEKTVRTYMHPDDDVHFTYWIFGAMSECTTDVSKTDGKFKSEYSKEKFINQIKRNQRTDKDVNVTFEKLD